MIIDCDTCTVRGPACGGCVMTVLLGAGGRAADPVMLGIPGVPDRPVEWDLAESTAIATLVEFGLVPPLRLVAASTDLTPVPDRSDTVGLVRRERPVTAVRDRGTRAG